MPKIGNNLLLRTWSIETLARSSHLSEQAEAESKNLVVQDGGCADLHLHAYHLPHEEEMVVAETDSTRPNGVSVQGRDVQQVLAGSGLG